MPLFSRDPILSRIVDALWERAKKRYVEEGGSPIEDLASISKEVKECLKDWVDNWHKEESKKWKVAKKEFKLIIRKKILNSLSLVILNSKQEWYSIEEGNLPSFPEVVAVPYDLLKEKTVKKLPSLLKEKIQFKNMYLETLEALSRHAVEKEYEKVFSEAAKKLIHFKIEDRTDPFIIVDRIKKDFYFLGDESHASLVDMVILSTFRNNITEREKEKKKEERKAVQRWKKRRNDPDGRSDNRRFTGKGWNLDNKSLRKISTKLTD